MPNHQRFALLRHGLLMGAFMGTLLLTFKPVAVHAQTHLPALGESASLSLGEEATLGDSIARLIYRDPSYLEDAVLSEYVNGTWVPLMNAARQRGELLPEMQERFAWQILLLRDRSVNAFAVPGGYLGVNLGLISVVSSRDELASVLGHELSHVTQRHIARLLDQRDRQTPLLLASIILGAIAASRNPGMASGVMIGGQALTAQNQLNFSRDMEREADRVGYGVYTQAGYAPAGFVSMFDKLQQASRLNDRGSFPYLRSHPLTTERIADMQARQQLLPAAPPVPMSVEHAMMAARARVLAAPGVETLRQWLNEPEASGFAQQAPAQQAGALYAAALSAMQQRDWALARKMLERLQTVVKSHSAALPWYQWLVCEVELAAGNPAPALALPVSMQTPRPALLLGAQARAQAALAAEKEDSAPQQNLKEAASVLQLWVSQYPRDASAWQTLSTAYSALNQPLQSLRAQAEVRMAHMDYSAALDRLKAAQELSRQAGANHVEASIIDSRMREVQALLREQARER